MAKTKKKPASKRNAPSSKAKRNPKAKGVFGNPSKKPLAKPVQKSKNVKPAKKILKPKPNIKNGNKSKIKNGTRNPQTPKGSQSGKKVAKSIGKQKGKKDQVRNPRLVPAKKIKKAPVKVQPKKKVVPAPVKKVAKKKVKAKKVIKKLAPVKEVKKIKKKKNVLIRKRKERGKPLSKKEIAFRKAAKNKVAREKRAKAASKEATKKRSRKKEAIERAKATKEKKAQKKKEISKERVKFEKFLRDYLRENKERIKIFGRGGFKRVASRIWEDYQKIPLEDIKKDFWGILINYTEEDVLELIDVTGEPIKIDNHKKLENIIAVEYAQTVWFETDEQFKVILEHRLWGDNFVCKIVDSDGVAVYFKTRNEFRRKYWEAIAFDKNQKNPPFDNIASSNIFLDYVEMQEDTGDIIYVFYIQYWLFDKEVGEQPPIPTAVSVVTPPSGEVAPAAKGEEKPAATLSPSKEDTQLQIEKEKTKQLELKNQQLDKVAKIISDARADLEKGLITPEIYRKILESIS